MSVEGPPSAGETERLAALARTGLAASPDAALDRFASMVRTVLKVPVALVSLVEADRQIFPGACGLAEPWQQQRQTSLSPSFGRHVVATAAPLIVRDARADPRVAGHPEITGRNVVGYAGMPLTDAEGHVLGSLCVIDTAPRDWSRDEITLLSDLAAACSDGLRLRIASAAAERREDQARARNARTGAAFDRSQLLLRASVALANTSTPDDVVSVVRDLATGTLDPAYVDVSLLDAAGWIGVQIGSARPPQVAGQRERSARTASAPSALAVHSGTPVLLPDLAAVRAAAPAAAGAFIELGWQSAASLPLPGPAGPVGALTFVWKQPYALDDAEQAVLAALAGYVAQALQRANYLVAREDTATVLQSALLSDLPDTAPFEVAARYEPATRGNEVGGDWYDAVRLDEQRLAVVVGDVTGHDIRAAALMGRLRSKLRLLLVDRHELPSALLRRLDTANRALGDRITASIVLAYLRPQLDGRDGHQLQWSNAGHPSPLLVTAAGCEPLTGRDPLLGVPGRRNHRTDHTRHLPPGSTVLLYTDGLIETRSQSLEDRERQLRQTLAELGGMALPELLDELYRRFAGTDHEDDVVMLALRTPPPSPIRNARYQD